MCELLTLSLRLSPGTLCRKLISANCILLLITQTSLPQVGVRMLKTSSFSSVLPLPKQFSTMSTLLLIENQFPVQFLLHIPNVHDQDPKILKVPCLWKANTSPLKKQVCCSKFSPHIWFHLTSTSAISYHSAHTAPEIQAVPQG